MNHNAQEQVAPFREGLLSSIEGVDYNKSKRSKCQAQKHEITSIPQTGEAAAHIIAVVKSAGGNAGILYFLLCTYRIVVNQYEYFIEATDEIQSAELTRTVFFDLLVFLLELPHGQVRTRW